MRTSIDLWPAQPGRAVVLRTPAGTRLTLSRPLTELRIGQPCHSVVLCLWIVTPGQVAPQPADRREAPDGLSHSHRCALRGIRDRLRSLCYIEPYGNFVLYFFIHLAKHLNWRR